jgi:hypothetical protein
MSLWKRIKLRWVIFCCEIGETITNNPKEFELFVEAKRKARRLLDADIEQSIRKLKDV